VKEVIVDDEVIRQGVKEGDKRWSDEEVMKLCN